MREEVCRSPVTDIAFSYYSVVPKVESQTINGIMDQDLIHPYIQSTTVLCDRNKS